METINQMASTAARAVWGDNSASEEHQEPISGAKGDVSKGEPYDAGNLDYDNQNKVESSLEDSNDNYTTSKEAKVTSSDTQHTNQGESQDASQRVSGKNTENPDTSKQKGSEKSANVDPEQGISPDELTGMGPRPIEIVAKEHGGNAAASVDDTSSSSAEDTSKKEEKKDDEKSSQESKPAGEEYVTATGFAADGGDFDATKPGAGREADRLLDQKGVHKDSDEQDGGGGSSSSSKDKDKPSLGERIKNKLHKH